MFFKKQEKWSIRGYEKLKVNNGFWDFDFIGECDEYKKKAFNKLRKKGIK